MPTPKYARREVRIDPRLVVPPGIVGVEIGSRTGSAESAFGVANNGSNAGVIRDERPTPNVPRPVDPNPVNQGNNNNPWGVAKIVSQDLIINSDGQLMVEVTFELPDWAGGYEERVNRI